VLLNKCIQVAADNSAPGELAGSIAVRLSVTPVQAVDPAAIDKKETTMKLLRVAALLTPLAFALPLNAHAAMDAKTKTTYMNECVAAAGQNNPGMDAKAVQSHCECGAQQINKSFTDKEIASLNDTNTPPSPELTARLQKAVGEHCLPGKK
jgi:hypothetical protein